MNLFSWKHTVLMSIIHAITITQETRFAGLGVRVMGDGAGVTAVLRYFFFVCDIRKKHRWALISPNGEAQM